jgi:hypothetical protein
MAKKETFLGVLGTLGAALGLVNISNTASASWSTPEPGYCLPLDNGAVGCLLTAHPTCCTVDDEAPFPGSCIDDLGCSC